MRNKKNGVCSVKTVRIKQIVIPAIIMFLFFTGAVVKETAIDSFAKKAQMAKKDIEESSVTLKQMKAVFDNTEMNIQAIKAVPESTGITGVINSIRLKYYLGSGNRLGFKIYKLEAGIRALKEDYFTYVSLITEEYGTRIKDCFDKKCPDLKTLCENRKKWASEANRYGDVLQIDLSSMKLIKDYSKGAEKDIKDYLQKKIIQAEQRIYMLEEEKTVLDIMKKAGLSAGVAEKQKNADEIAALKKLKKELQLEIRKIK